MKLPKANRIFKPATLLAAFGSLAALGLLLCLGLAAAAVFHTQQSLQHLRNFELEAAGQKAAAATKLLTPISNLTFHQISDLEFWITSLELIEYQNESFPQLVSVIKQPFATEENLQKNQNQIPDRSSTKNKLSLTTQILNTNYAYLNQLNQLCLQSKFINRHPLLDNCQTLTQLESALSDINHTLEIFSEKEISFLVLFQNTEELRATGGFMGSYARLEITGDGLSNVEIHDIYEPDGQFTGFVNAPPGVAEYLSSGEGLRLPDSNWYPDFPISAKAALSYFALGGENSIDGVIAVNSDFLEDVLKVTGQIYLPDYDQMVTAQTLTTAARANRDQFFPGSQQKKHFLSLLFNQLSFKAETLTTAQIQELAKLVTSATQSKDLQFYATDPELQKLFDTYQLSGRLPQLGAQQDLLYLVESNVGINKANKLISREVALRYQDLESQLRVTFHNHHSAENPLAYVNYQRLILPPGSTVTKMTFSGQEMSNWDENVFLNDQGQSFTQIGVLLPILAGSIEEWEVTYTSGIKADLLSGSSGASQPTLTIIKQPGLPPTPYDIQLKKNSKKILLEKDTVINL